MADFKIIHNTLGLAAMAAAEATGTPINLTHIVVVCGVSRMNVDQAIREVELRHAERIAAPGKWRVWRNGNTVRHEVFSDGVPHDIQSHQ